MPRAMKAADGLIEKQTTQPAVDRVHAAAERLAQERG
jgi:hypothetical protein